MLPPRLKAVLLDFDHTLAHLGTFVRWADARRALLPLYRAAGVPASFLSAHGGSLDLYGAIAATPGLLPEADLLAVQLRASRLLDRFEREAIPRTVLLPSAATLLRRLPVLGLRMGVVTSNSGASVLALLNRNDAASTLEVIVGRDDVREPKPSPEGILRCCAAMDVSPGSCVYVGDSVGDITAARAAGMVGFGVRAGNSSVEELVTAGAAAILNDLEELLALLEKHGPAPAMTQSPALSIER